MIITAEEIIEKFPDIEEFFKTPKRLYNVQGKYDLSRGEAQLITDILLREGYIESNSLGWKVVK